MLQPNPGKLLRALHVALSDSVLPELASGQGYRQLKAAIHLVKRLERTWDLYPAHVHADNADIEKTLAAVFGLTAGSSHELTFAEIRVRFDESDAVDKRVGVDGVNDPDLGVVTHKNLQLQALLSDVDNQLADCSDTDEIILACRKLLFELYRRMVARDSVYVGDLPALKQSPEK